MLQLDWNKSKVRYGVKVLLLPPECDVCGQEVHPMFLQAVERRHRL